MHPLDFGCSGGVCRLLFSVVQDSEPPFYSGPKDTYVCVTEEGTTLSGPFLRDEKRERIFT